MKCILMRIWSGLFGYDLDYECILAVLGIFASSDKDSDKKSKPHTGFPYDELPHMMQICNDLSDYLKSTPCTSAELRRAQKS